jgi:hypothetical protein
MSKDIDQVLNIGDSITVYINKENIKLESKNEVPLHLNSNYVCQTATDTIDFSKIGIKDFRLKLSQEVAIAANDKSPVSLNNYKNGDTYYTKFSFDDKKKSLELNTFIPENKFGLLMIYCVSADLKYIKIPGDDAPEMLKLFNTDSSD